MYNTPTDTPTPTQTPRENLEFARNGTENCWVRISKTGVLSKSGDAESWTPLPNGDLGLHLFQRQAVPVDLELVTRVKAANSAQVEPALALVMDNRANLYTYDFDAAAVSVVSVTSGIADVTDFEIGSRGVDRELYLLRYAESGTIVDVTPQLDGPYFQAVKPWVDDEARALNIELVTDATGHTRAVYVLSDKVTPQGKGVVYRVDRDGSFEKFQVPVPLAEGENLAFAASPRDNILMLWRDPDPEDEDPGTIYSYRRIDDPEKARDFIACGTEILGFPGIASEDFFSELAWTLQNYSFPASATTELFEGNIELVYRVNVPIIKGYGIDLTKLEDICSAIDGATPDQRVDHVALFCFSSRVEAIQYAKEVADIIEYGTATSIPYYWWVWGPGVGGWPDAREWIFFDTEQELPDSDLLNTLAEYNDCRGFYLTEIYNGGQLIDAWGKYRQGKGYDAEKYLFGWGENKGLIDIAVDSGKRILWHEAGNAGPGGSDGQWNLQRVGWWGFAMYDGDIYESLFNDPKTVEVFVQMHEDIQFTADTANLGTVFGNWLASPNRARWGTSVQGFWWLHTQTRYEEETIRLSWEDARNALGMDNIFDNTPWWVWWDQYIVLQAFPGYNPDEANWAEIPPDLTSRQILQSLMLGATVFQFEHSPYVLNHSNGVFDDNFYGWGTETRAGGIQPLMERVADGTLKVPAKSAVRHLAGVPLFLENTKVNSEKPAGKFWANEDEGYISGDLGEDNSYRFGIFVPDFRVFGYNDGGENILWAPVLPTGATETNYRGWIPPGYCSRFVAGEQFSNDDFGPDTNDVPMNRLSAGWAEIGATAGIVESSTGYRGEAMADNPSGSGVWDFMSQKITVNGTMNREYRLFKPLHANILHATPNTITTCKVVVSASAEGLTSLGQLRFGYMVHSTPYLEDVYNDPPDADHPDLHWTDVSMDANQGWTRCESGQFSVTGTRPVVSIWIMVDDSVNSLEARIDDFFILARDAQGGWYPATALIERLSGFSAGRKRITRDANYGGLQFTPWIVSDLFLPEVIEDGTKEWSSNPGYWTHGNYEEAIAKGWLAKYGLYSCTDTNHPAYPNVSSATAYSCSFEYFDIHRKYFAGGTAKLFDPRDGFEPMTETDLDGDDYMPLSSIPLPQPVIISATTPRGWNRYLYKYCAYQKRNTDCLLADSRLGFIPLAPGVTSLGGHLPSWCRMASTNGMDVRLGAPVQIESATIEPMELGRYLEFLEPAKMVTVVCSATGEGEWVNREIHVSLTCIGNEPLGNGIYETTYQLILFDAVEGGIEISPAMRCLEEASRPENSLTANVRINGGHVVSFIEDNLLQGSPDIKDITDEQVFIIDLPRYYYESATFVVQSLR